VEWLALIACWLPSFLWIPVARLFWRNWRSRGNPLSLANFNAIIGGMYCGPAAWFALGKLDRSVTLSVMMGMNALVAIGYLVAMAAAKKFPDQRHPAKDEF
jgi:hypothetical protein